MSSPKLRGAELCSTSPKPEYLHKLFRLLHRRFVSCPPLIYLFISVWMMHICCILWVIIQYYFIHFVAQIVLDLVIGNSFRWLLYPFDTPPLLWSSLPPFLPCLLSYLTLLFGTAGCSRLILHISGSSPRSSHFPKDPWFLPLKNDVRN